MAHYAEARQIWTALADRGQGEAWFNLGILAEDGLGEPRDGTEARRRYERAAQAGSRNAALRLGTLLQTARLGAPDPAAATTASAAVPPAEPRLCPHCHRGRLVFLRMLSRAQAMGP